MDPPRPHISASAQDRILIWRTEVASACDPEPPHSPLDDSAASLANSSSSAATITTTGGASSTSPPTAALSRGRRFLRRLSRRLTGRSGPDDDMTARATGHEPVHTAMYRSLASPVAEGEHDHDLALSEASSQPGAARGLREKQERLMRAAKLLNQSGIQPSDGAA